MFAEINTLKGKAIVWLLSILFILSIPPLFLESRAWADCTSCDGCPPPTLGYTSKQISTGGQQTLTASGGYGNFQWTKNGGGGLGTPTGERSQSVVYSAPSTQDGNANCLNNPTITLTDSCGRTVKASFAVNAWNGGDAAYYECPSCSSVCDRDSVGWCYYTNNCSNYKCNGELLWGSFRSCLSSAPEGCGGYCSVEEYWERCPGCCESARAHCNTTACPGGCDEGYHGDRTPAMSTGGCCPAFFLSCTAAINNFLDRPPINASGGEGITITGLITYELGTSGSWTLTVEGTGRTFQGSGVNVSQYWDGRNSEGKVVDPGKHTVRLDVQVSGGQCQNGIETKTAQIEVANVSCQDQESGTCKPVFSISVPTDPPKR
jgi:hypothetical protein